MTESSFRSYDPLAYHVNNIGDLNKEVVLAHRNKNTDEIKQLLTRGDPTIYDVFICVNKSWHAFVMCVPANDPSNDPLDPFADIPTNDPFAIPNQLLVWETELCYESVEERMYKIRFQLSMFREIKEQIKRSFYIGKYKQLTAIGLQFAVLRSSPKRYKVLLDDCVEFAKTFCYELLSFCGNGRDIERSVLSQLEKASGSGLSIEKLSRRVRSSAWVGNSLLGGLDMSTFIGGRWSLGMIILAVALWIITQIVVSLVVSYILITVMMTK